MPSIVSLKSCNSMDTLNSIRAIDVLIDSIISSIEENNSFIAAKNKKEICNE
jgi:hypothetical protein